MVTIENKIVAMNWYDSLTYSQKSAFLRANFPKRVFGSITDYEIAEVYFKIK